MPVLNKNATTKKIVLPNSSKPGDEAWVEIETELLTGHLDGVDLEAPHMQMAIQLISRIIKDWNFTEADGTKSPITEESIRLLPLADVTAIFEQTALEKKLGTLSKQKKSPSSPT